MVLYHGGLFPWRGIEQLIEAIRDIPDATLVLMGYGVLEPTLRAWEADPALGGRVRVMGPVPPAELHDWVACADVVGMPIQGDTLNHRLTTPNKLFEAMAAGRAGGRVRPARDERGRARTPSSGILVDPTDTAAIAAAIRQILDLPEAEWLAWSERCVAAAHDRYNWETQVERLLDAVHRADREALVTDGTTTERAGAARRPRAVVLVGNPANPYSRAIRLGRALIDEGYEVEIASAHEPGAAARGARGRDRAAALSGERRSSVG